MGPVATVYQGNRRADRRPSHHPAGKSQSDNNLNQSLLGVVARVPEPSRHGAATPTVAHFQRFGRNRGTDAVSDGL